MSTPYPHAVQLGDAVVYDTFADDKLRRIVVHTTETAWLPDYNNGRSSPHFTIDPVRNQVWQHANLNESVGTLADPSGGVRTNREGSIQVEMICYSAKGFADQSSSRTWVGDLKPEHYRNVAKLLAWIAVQANVPLALYPNTSTTTTLDTMSNSEWTERAVNGVPWGICGHNNVPENINGHWDPGALNRELLLQYIIEETGMYPIKYGDNTSNVEWLQAKLERLGHTVAVDGIFGDATAEAWKAEFPAAFGNTANTDIVVTGKWGERLDQRTQVSAVQNTAPKTHSNVQHNPAFLPWANLTEHADNAAAHHDPAEAPNVNDLKAKVSEIEATVGVLSERLGGVELNQVGLLEFEEEVRDL